jgi:hypothetical protein
VIPYAEHRPASVDEGIWREYVGIMTDAAYGRVTPPGAKRLVEIYDEAPEIVEAGRGLDFRPRF